MSQTSSAFVLALVVMTTNAPGAYAARLVKDINPGENSSIPHPLTSFNGNVFFGADGGVDGFGLWKSDGTAGGTVLVKDVHPITLVVAGGTLFFSSRDDSSSGSELWGSDGTAAGTTLLKDIYPGPMSSYPGSFTAVGDRLFFHADNGSLGSELWVTDGTAAGTVLVKDIFPGPDGSAFSEERRRVAAYRGMLYFSASDGVQGSELWKSDGTPDGTVLVKDIAAGAAGSFPSNLTVVNDTLYFGVSTSVGERDSFTELWKTDGTAEGTVLVKQVRRFMNESPSTYEQYLAPFIAFRGMLIFTVSDDSGGFELWKSDGTPAGTEVVEIFPANGSLNPRNLTVVNDTLYFSANDGVNGMELWKTDGTTSGTVLVRDIYPGPDWSSPSTLVAAGGLLYFSGADGIHGHELWRSNGTAAGTVLVQDIWPGHVPGTPAWEFWQPLVSGQRLFFTAEDGVHGWELWSQALPPPSQISISDAAVRERNAGAVLAVFTVSLSAPSEGTVAVQFATADGTATAPGDYAAATGTVTFAPGQVSKTISVSVNGDLSDEPTETFTVNLSTPHAGAVILDGQGVGHIIGDDTPLSDPATVYRLRHPTIGAYLFTVHPVERDSAMLQYGYVYEGRCCNWFTSAATDGRMPLFRLYSAAAGEYFFTIYPQERDSAVANYGYVYEGRAAYCHRTMTPEAPTPWYRLRMGNKHLYTAYASERDSAVALGWTLEGVSCYLP